MKVATFARSFCWNAPYIPMIASVTWRSASAEGGFVSLLAHADSVAIRIAGRIVRMDLSVLNNGIEIPPLELLLAVEERKLQEARAARHHAADLLDQLAGADQGSSRRQHVVHDQDALTLLHRVPVDLHRVRAVFQLVALLDRLPGKLAQLADWDQPHFQARRHRRAEEEAARLDARHELRPALPAVSLEGPDDPRERRRILQHRRDVLEDDPLLREVGDVPDQRLHLVRQVGHLFTLVGGNQLLV